MVEHLAGRAQLSKRVPVVGKVWCAIVGTPLAHQRLRTELRTGSIGTYHRGVPARLRQLAPDEFAAIRERIDAGTADPRDLRAATKHLLAALAEKAPGNSVEVRVPPYAAVQCIPGASHTRGTPPAVVEMDAETWIALALGREHWSDAVRDGRVNASGERSDLSAYLPIA